MRLIRKIEDGVIRITGDKAAALLSGQLTGAVKSLSVGQSQFELLLTLKGKIRTGLWLKKNAENIFDLLVPHNHLAAILENLSRMAPLSKCVVTQVPARIFHMLADDDHVPGSDWVRADRIGPFGYDLVTDDNVQLSNLLQAFDAKELDDNTWVQRRHQHGIPEIGVDVDESNMPQECGLLPFVDFKKGCYLGQEVVARLFYRGHVNQVLCVLEAESGKVQAGDAVCDINGERISSITSVAVQVAGKRTVMAMMPIKLVKQSDVVYAAGSQLKLIWSAPEK